MNHSPLPLSVPLPDEEFDASEEVTKEGIERRVDFLFARVHDLEREFEERWSLIAVEIREANDAAKRTEAAVLKLAETQDRLIKLILEERAERFALGDRVSKLEQPRTTRKRK